MRPLSILALSLSIVVAISCSHGSSKGITVRIEPSQVTMRPGESMPFVASVSGATNLVVFWSVDEGDEGGTVGSNGVYVAPNWSGYFHVTAASREDPSKTATASITVTDSSVAESDGGVAIDSGRRETISTTNRPDTAPAPVDTADEDVPVDPGNEKPIPLIGPLTFTHPNSPDPLPLYPPDDPMPDSKELNDKINIVVTSPPSGVAPLYVFFDASKSLKAADGDVDMQATYIWSFDTKKIDPNNRYNRASGFVAGHVFNLPGKYTVRLDVFDKDRQHGFKEIVIEATEFKGKTYFVSAGGNDNNPGTRAKPFLTAKRAFQQAKPNTQILFHGGDKFSLAETALEGEGPVIISGYGDDPNQPPAKMPELNNPVVDSDYWLFVLAGNDWRLVGLKLSATGTSVDTKRYPRAINLVGKNNLISRCEFANLSAGFGMGGEGSNAIYENDMHLLGTCGIFDSEALARVSVIGNYMHDWVSDHEEHAYRMQKGSGYFIGFNVIEANDTKSGVQIRGDSDHIILYGNVLDRSNGVHPQNTDSPPREIQHHVVVDSNVFIGRTDQGYANTFTVRQEALFIGAKDVVVRNNVVYNYDTAIAIEDDRPNIDRTERVWIENNTVVSPTAGALFSDQDDALAVSIVNNVHYSTASSSNRYDGFLNLSNTPFDSKSQSNHNLFFGKSWSLDMNNFFGPDIPLAKWRASTNQDADSKFEDPGIATIVPTEKSFALPSAEGPVVNAGIKTGNWADARGRLRGSQPDLGAFEVKP